MADDRDRAPALQGARATARRVLRVDPWIDPHTAPLRQAYAGPLAAWIADRAQGRRLRLLDLGCGDLQSRWWAPEGSVVDGWDVSEAAREAARRTLRELGRPGWVADEPGELPLAAYDGIVVASVLQYLRDRAEVTTLLRSICTWLKPDAPIGAVVTDVIAGRVDRLGDLLDAGRHAHATVGLVRGSEAMVRNALRSSGSRLAVAEVELVELAGTAGLATTKLPANLSPLRGRNTYVLRVGPS